jgi:hypothetical protein
MAWRYRHASTIRHLALTVLNLDRVPKAGRRAVLAWELPAKLTRAVAHVKGQQEPPLENFVGCAMAAKVVCRQASLVKG